MLCYELEESFTTLALEDAQRYLLVGTKTGKVFQYLYSRNIFLSHLHAFAGNRSVSALSLYKDLCLAAANDGTLCLLNLITKQKHLAKPTHRAISSLLFLNKNSFLVGDEGGTLYLCTAAQNLEFHPISTPLERISQIVAIQESSFVFVHSSSHTLVLVDLSKRKTVSPSYLRTHSPITQAAYLQETLYLTLQDGSCIKQDPLCTQKLYEALLHNNLKSAYDLTQTNPLLLQSPLYKQLIERQTTAYRLALQELQRSCIDEAKFLLQPYTQIPQTKHEALDALKAIEHYPRFCELAVQKKYTLVYAMSMRYPFLQRTQSYKKTEQNWRDHLLEAQKSLLASNKDRAKELLEPFLPLQNKREIIKFVLSHNKIFLSFLKATQKGDLHTLFAVAKQHKELRSLAGYTLAQERIFAEFAQIKENIQNGDLAKAQIIFDSLKGIEGFEKNMQKLQKQLIATRKLYQAYDADEFIDCYILLDNNPSLCNTQLAKLLESHWLKTIQNCEEYALCGDINEIKDQLKDLLTLSSRKEKIDDLLRLGFYFHIQSCLDKKHSSQAQSMFYAYIDQFGQDCAILKIMRHYEDIFNSKLAITASVQ